MKTEVFLGQRFFQIARLPNPIFPSVSDKDFVAFGNDQNDISLFKNAIYGVQIGDYPYLKNFADEVIPAINAVIAEKIRLLFEKF